LHGKLVTGVGTAVDDIERRNREDKFAGVSGEGREVSVQRNTSSSSTSS